MKMNSEHDFILNGAPSEFLNLLSAKFAKRIGLLLANRDEADSPSKRLDFLSETKKIRDSDWKIAELPDHLQNRRVEITGPVERKMVINAMNSGANVFMADFEDSNSPTWGNCLDGQVNLYDAIRGTIGFENENGKKYKLDAVTATLFVRPRGLHLKEKNFLDSEGNQIPASLFDFGLFAFHNAEEMIDNGETPCFYIPKLESYLEARLWADIFSFTESFLSIRPGTFKATVLVETLPLAFQMDEVLFELRNYSAGLNCGRWDYIFSFMKSLSPIVLPDRDQLTMGQHFMRSYTQLLIQTCHKRGAHAMGGMAAQIPIKNDDVANEAAMQKVRQDKEREVTDGHDGTWVAHPGLISIAKEIFDKHMPDDNQINNKLENIYYPISQEDLLHTPVGACTEDGFRKNINIGFTYLHSWMQGRGCVPINNLMEDAATAEISRTQIWQWIHHGVMLDNGNRVSREYFNQIFDEEIKESADNSFARDTFKKLCLSNKLDKFLTTMCYDYI
jgi:malate synthase